MSGPAILNAPFAGGIREVDITGGNVTTTLLSPLYAGLPSFGPHVTPGTNGAIFSLASIAGAGRGSRCAITRIACEITPSNGMVYDGSLEALTWGGGREWLEVYGVPVGETAVPPTVTRATGRLLCVAAAGVSMHDIDVAPDIGALFCIWSSPEPIVSAGLIPLPDGTYFLASVGVSITLALNR